LIAGVATLLGELVEGILRAFTDEPDLEAFKQSLLNAERRAMDIIAKENLRNGKGPLPRG
jgi:hypothetical protein